MLTLFIGFRKDFNAFRRRFPRIEVKHVTGLHGLFGHKSTDTLLVLGHAWFVMGHDLVTGVEWRRDRERWKVEEWDYGQEDQDATDRRVLRHL